MKKIFKFTCMFLCLLFLGIVLTACGGGGGGSTGGGGFAYFPTTNTSDNSVNNPSDNNGNTGDNTGNSGDNTGNTGDNTGNSGDNTGNSGDNTGNSGDNAGNSGDNAGNSGDNTGNSGDNTGNSGDNTGNNEDNTGNSGDNTGNTGDNTGNTGDNTGNSGDNTGNSGDNTGNSGDNTGNTGDNTGNSGDNTGNSGDNTGNTGDNTGNTGDNTGNIGDNTGNSGDNSGNSGDNTGNSGDNTGNSGDNTGNSGDNTGNSGDNTGNSGDNTGNSGDNSGNIPPNPFANAQVGDYVEMGSYPQTETGEVKPIEWKVLRIDNTNNKVLVVSRYSLDNKSFNSSSNIWHNSAICQWLNSDFYNGAFNDTEKSYIKSVDIDNNSNNYNVFLLSKPEVEQYLEGTARYCTATAYAIKQGASNNSSGHCYWWLRSPLPDYNNYVYNVADNGAFYWHTYNTKNAIRPALWIDLNIGDNTGDNGNTEDNTPNPFANAKVGDYVSMGKYKPQSGYGHNTNTYSIDWLVLAKNEPNNRLLVVSRYGFITQTFNKTPDWLNGYFYNNTFTNAEKNFIASTEFYEGIYYGTYNVFILSKYEAETYFADNNARKCKPLYVDYSVNLNGDYDNWWLRSLYIVNGANQSGYIWGVSNDGKITVLPLYKQNNYNMPNYNLVRPAMWIQL